MKHVIVLFACLVLATPMLVAQQQPWVSAYYAGWMQDDCPPSVIDYGAVTHIMHFSISPTGGPNIDGSGNGITTSSSAAIIRAAHAAGKKVLITCGGWGDASAYGTATNATNRAAFIANLVNFVTTHGYDGLDIDWEPITSTNQFRLFIPELRAALDAAKPGLLLTIAAMDDNAAAIAPVQNNFDQINIMTYDMSGAWEGWVVWHNAPVYDGGLLFPGTSVLVPSADGDVKAFMNAGIAKNKIGIGADFYGYVWTGVTRPRQTWTTAPNVTDNVPYYQLMTTYAAYTPEWDSVAQAAFISVTTGGGKFVSYDNEQTMAAKGAYVKSKGIGGMIIWELGGGYRPTAPAGQRDKLLQAVKQAFFSQPTDVPAPVAGAGSYRLDQNYPNPFNPETQIRFTVAESGPVRLAVFDLLGREIAVLASGITAAGEHAVRFDGTGIASGVYYSRLETAGGVFTRPMVLVR